MDAVVFTMEDLELLTKHYGGVFLIRPKPEWYEVIKRELPVLKRLSGNLPMFIIKDDQRRLN